MKKFWFLLPVTLSYFLTLSGQRSESEIALREYFIDAEFFLEQEYYIDALSDYMQVYKRGYKDNPNINYRIGICYLKIPGQKDKSIAYLEKAAASASPKYKESSLNEKNAPIDVYLYLGNAYRVNNRLTDAINAYQKYKTLLPEDEVNLHQYADKQIEACKVAQEFMSRPVGLTFEDIGDDLNSSSDDYNPVVSGDGSTLAFMHKLPFYDAIYISRFVDGHWSKPENITPQVMSDGNQFVTDLSYDGKTLYLSVQDEFNSDIYTSKYVDNRWTPSESMGPEINTKYWESHASISEDGNTLYFASNRTGGAGNMDLYMSKKNALGIFGPAQNIKELNTDLNEDTPFVTSDGKCLYFSSQGYANMGGYDIFVSKLSRSGKWTTPENLGYPVSTTDDDLFYFPLNDGAMAYMARVVDTGFGAMDMFRIVYTPESIESIAELARDTELPVLAEQKETEKSTEPIVEQPVEKVAESVETAVVTDTTSKEAVVAETEQIEEKPVQEIEVKTFEISPVFFEFDRSQLSEKGKMELNKIAEFLKEYGDLKLVLYGFADALGPDTYNLSLSQRRAASALNYLVSKGIQANRIKAVGKGETEFIAPNTHPDGSDNPEGRKFNRRVEFEISGINTNLLIIKRIDPVPVDLRIHEK